MAQTGRTAAITSEVFRNQWLSWKEALGNYREICDLAHYFAFRKGGELSVDTISKFLNAPAIPVRPQGFTNLFTMLGAAHWRGLIADRQAFAACLEQWGIATSADAGRDWERIWDQITDGIRAYEEALRSPPKPAPPVKAPGVPLWQRARTRRGAAILIPALLALLVLAGFFLWQLEQINTHSAAQRLTNRLNSTYVAALGGIPNSERTYVPAEVFATATALAATEAAAVLQAANPTAITLPVGDVRMMYVPEGCMWVGSFASVRSNPVFFHCLPSFWMDEYKVSNAQYRQVMQMEPRSRSCTDYGWEACASLPVENITWGEARDFCATRGDGARLPTELEWEYAARGPMSYVFPWGNQFDSGRVDARGQILINTAPGAVSGYENGRSWAGVVGLVGGVNEWTSSLWAPYPYAEGETREDAADTRSARVLRGASFIAEAVGGERLAAYNRGDAGPGTRTYLTGFRCVRDA